MRLNELAEAVAARRRAEGRRGDFDAALRRAEATRSDGARAETTRSERGVEDRLAETARGEGQGGGAGAAGLGDGPVKPTGAGFRDRPEQDRAQPASVASSGAAGPGAQPMTAGPGHAALVEAVRALPPVIEAFGRSGREVLVLKLGGAIGVELRRAPGGVEVGLSVPAALRPAARTELASLCAALAARGVTVVSAEVRGGAPLRGRWR